jgi:deoxyribodipyrimidine photo-lyase
VLDGMAERQFDRSVVAYHPYVELTAGAGRGLIRALADDACVIVSDRFPAFFLPRMNGAAAQRVGVRLETVDSNGLVPLDAASRAYPTAYLFRRFLHEVLLDCLGESPDPTPLKRLDLPRLSGIPPHIAKRWPAADLTTLTSEPNAFDSLPLDHTVGPVSRRGGSRAAKAALKRFLQRQLPQYGERRNHPEADATSGLSPYLHYGHTSTFEVVHTLFDSADWDPSRIEPAAKGRRSGWWGLDENAESFLDELVTWREVGFNTCAFLPEFDTFESLPSWAIDTLTAHMRDARPHLYPLERFERAETHDELWNAAQRQLVAEGGIHGYLRMLWGKKILEWSPTPHDAFATMVHLNNKYALDGRDPSSYSGISWVLGRYDRPWARERPVFGRIRYMSSANTARKFRVRNYIARYASEPLLWDPSLHHLPTPMPTFILERTQTVPGDLDTVFAFFEDPHNLRRITPPWLRFEVRWASDPSVQLGTRIRYTIHWLGLPMRWESRIARYEQNQCFADEMLRGPYRSWFHTHTFRAVPHGIEVHDRVEYSLPLGPLGSLVHRIMVRRQLEAIFDYRTRTLAEIFGETEPTEG